MIRKIDQQCLEVIRACLITLIVFMFSLNMEAQQVEVSGVYAGSNFNKFQNTFGYSIAYFEDLTSRHRIGLCFWHYFYNRTYSDIYPSSDDGVSTYIHDVQPKNSRMAIKVNYSYGIVNNPKSVLFIGSELGLNYFIVDEHIYQYPDHYNQEREYDLKYKENNKWSLGVFLDFELKDILTKQISLFSSIHPEIVFFREAGMEGYHAPRKTRWMNVKLGIRYRLF